MGQLYSEFKRTQHSLKLELASLFDSFRPVIADSLWNLNDVALVSAMQGMQKFHSLLGIKVLNQSGEVVKTMGFVEEPSDKKVYFNNEEKSRKNIFSEVYTYHYPVLYESKEKVGEVVFFSSSKVVVEKVKYGFLLIVLNAFIKTTILWLIFIFYIRKFVGRPLSILTSFTRELNPDNPGYLENISPIEKLGLGNNEDEIGLLSHSFDKMRRIIIEKISKLNALNKLGETLFTSKKIKSAFVKVSNLMRGQYEFKQSLLYLKENGSFHFTFQDGASDSEKLDLTSFADNSSEFSALLEQKKPYYSQKSEEDDYLKHLGENLKGGLLVIPLFEDNLCKGCLFFRGGKSDFKIDNEVESYLQTVVRLFMICRRGISMLQTIAEQNHTLEEKVEQRTEELKQKNNDIQGILQNMRQGICTFRRDWIIDPDYSKYLEEILETNIIVGQKIPELFFSNSSLGADVVDQMTSAINNGIGEDKLQFVLNSHLLATKVIKTFPDGRLKYLEFNWECVLNGDDKVEKIIMITRDTTELKKLEEESSHASRELKIIGEILNVSLKKFDNFLLHSRNNLNHSEEQIKSVEISSQEIVNQLFRSIHTIKGNARLLGLIHLTDLLHLMEVTLCEFRDGKRPWDREFLLNLCQEATKHLHHYAEVFNLKLKKFVENEIGTEKNTEGESVAECLKDLIGSLPSLAQELGKESPQVIINNPQFKIPNSTLSEFKDIFVHLLRNSLDHGLEPSKERINAKKDKSGKIYLNFTKVDGKIKVEIYDDGRGLPLDFIHKKSMELGLLQDGEIVEPEKLAQIIFHSGLTTKEKASTVSGRGVGMDAVKDLVGKLGGDINIKLNDGKVLKSQSSTDPYRPFKILIQVPEKKVKF